MTHDTDPPAPDLGAPGRRLRRSLPKWLRRFIDSYDRFTDGEPPEDAKDFSAHHTAGKAALAHLEQLIRLARDLGPPQQTPSAPRPGMDDPVAQARAALADRSVVKTNDEEPST